MKSKRIGYIGLSSIILFDYKNTAKKTKNDTDLYGSPNPILESPFGLMLLYDELWFLCESLCPNNMRKLSYVRYIDKLFPNLNIGEICKKSSELDAESGSYDTYDYFNKICEAIQSTHEFTFLLRSLGVDCLNGVYDHKITVSKAYLTPSPSFLSNFIFDTLIVDYLGECVELITNSRSACFETSNNNSAIKPLLIETLLIKNIPNYISIKGPYHPSIDEARKDPYLKDFRKWIIKDNSNINRKEIAEICSETEASLKRIQDKLFLKYLDTRGYYTSIGKTILSTAIDFIIPQASLGLSIIGNVLSLYRSKEHRWQGFIVRANNKYFNNN